MDTVRTEVGGATTGSERMKEAIIIETVRHPSSQPSAVVT